MLLNYKTSWIVNASTENGKAELMLDTGAAASVLSINSLAQLLSVRIKQAENYVKNLNIEPAVFRQLDGGSTVLYPLVLPKIKVGNIILKEFYVYVSMSVNSTSVIGRDFLSNGILNLQYKTRGTFEHFDELSYRESCSRRTYHKLAFLDYD